MRTSLFRHLQGLSLDFFERRRLGDVISRLTGDISAIESFVLSGVTDALSYAMRIVFFAGALFFIQWDLALVALLVAPLFWLSARHFSRLIKVASREKRRRSGSISSVAEESLSNAALVQAYNRQDAEVDRFHRENLGSFAATMASTRLRALYSPLIDLIELCGAMLVIGLGTWELSRGAMTLGELLVFLTFLTQLYSPVRGLGRLANTIYAASAAAERIIEFLDLEPAVADRPGARTLGRARGAIELDQVGFRYPETPEDALTDVSLRVEPGQVLALVGPSGAGKSTVAKLVLRFYDPAAARSVSTGPTSARSASSRCGRTWRCSCRRPSSSTARFARTSSTGARAPRRTRSSPRHAPPTRTRSSAPCRRATRRRSDRRAGASPAASGSASRSLGR